ncbi:MAG TPA: restriction endonuclease subunit S [Rhodoglobus sp.]|nr:restriction endonuclease subunit S [Rhodoglobus sp.]
MSLDLDKSTWQRVAFGDVVRNANETVKNAAAGPIDRIIAMEHMDPGELKIERWGDAAGGTTFTRRARPGQTLFGKRRAYQRKVAYAEFDAICSGDIYTFEADETRMLGEFLPFLVQSDPFFDHALDTSAGSLSPRTNWRDLADFEFDLPPLDEQKRIADLLWAIERRRTAEFYEESAAQRAISDFCLTTYLTLKQAHPKALITAIAEPRMGRQKSPRYATGEFSTPYLRVANIGELELNLDSVEEMDFDARDRARFSLRFGDVLLTEGDIVSPLNVGRAAMFSGELPVVCFQNTLIRLRPINGTIPGYLVALCEGLRLTGVFAAAASTTTVTHLGLGRLSSIEIPIVPLAVQRRIARDFDAILSLRATSRSAQTSSRNLRSAFLAEFFGGN